MATIDTSMAHFRCQTLGTKIRQRSEAAVMCMYVEKSNGSRMFRCNLLFQRNEDVQNPEELLRQR